MSTNESKSGCLGLIILFIILFAGWYFWNISDSSVAKGIAKGMTKEKLKSPSSASFQKVKILDKKNDKYIVHVIVDAENSYGATIRNSYLVSFKVLKKAYVPFVGGDEYRPGSFSECSIQPSDYEIQLFKELIDF